MLTPTYDFMLVLASIAVSIMASFTGLVLTRGISSLDDTGRKFVIVMASLALGGGIWSMHFVAMLAMNLPVPITYDAAYTLGSALIAVLMSGTAFLIVHFSGRSFIHIAVAGTLMGNGIVAMHYVGMSGIRGCIPTFEPTGIALAVTGGTIVGIVALYICYMKRTTAHIFSGAVLFGLSVAVVHFVAMGWTGFREGGSAAIVAPLINHGMLALLVMLSAFVICGTFLLTTTNFILPGTARNNSAAREAMQIADTATPALAGDDQAGDKRTPKQVRLPYEQDKRTYFIDPQHIAAIRAEGHYTIIYTETDKLFCPLSISTVEKRLEGQPFMRTHRSYLVNMERVSAFERAKDNGRCLFENVVSLKSAPVSRNFVPKVRTALGI